MFVNFVIDLRSPKLLWGKVKLSEEAINRLEETAAKNILGKRIVSGNRAGSSAQPGYERDH